MLDLGVLLDYIYHTFDFLHLLALWCFVAASIYLRQSDIHTLPDESGMQVRIAQL